MGRGLGGVAHTSPRFQVGPAWLTPSHKSWVSGWRALATLVSRSMVALPLNFFLLSQDPKTGVAAHSDSLTGSWGSSWCLRGILRAGCLESGDSGRQIPSHH